ncbi:MAG: T9SS type A sorting domain-containing protein [Rhodothermaceae bacterium]|nr:T9SS type A sorting domain-containing protein [Rhodothermaceae bacterium]
MRTRYHHSLTLIPLFALFLTNLHLFDAQAQDRALFWLQDSNIYRLDLDTGDAQSSPMALLPDTSEWETGFGLAIDPVNHMLYWHGGPKVRDTENNPFPPNVYRSDFNGEEIVGLDFFECGLGGVTDLELDVTGNLMYVLIISDCSGDLQRATLDGSNKEGEVIAVIPFEPGRMTLDPLNYQMYWTDSFFEPAIQITDLTTSITSTLINVSATDLALDLKQSMIYWTTSTEGNGKIQRMPLNSGEVETVLEGLNNPSDIALDVDGNTMYWVEPDSGRISMARLDGSEKQVITSGLNNPKRLALSFENNGVPSTGIHAEEVPQIAQWSVYPNPTQSDVTVSFTVPESSPVHITVYDLLGRTVATLTSSQYAPGNHQANWNPTNTAPGVYLVQLDVAGQRETRKVVVY